MAIVKITKASQKDKGVTIRTNQFNHMHTKAVLTFKINGKHHAGKFHDSRDGKTMYSEDWSGPQPGVGAPIYGTIINQTKA